MLKGDKYISVRFYGRSHGRRQKYENQQHQDGVRDSASGYDSRGLAHGTQRQMMS